MWELIILSNNRESGTNENLNITVPYFSQIKLLEATIPNTFNNIPAGSFTVDGTINGLQTVTITAGRYTESTFLTHLNLQLSVLLGAYTASVAAGKITISSAETFIADFTNYGYIGFKGVQPLSASITGTSIASTLEPFYIYLVSNNIYGIDNGTILVNQNLQGIIHAIPLCASGTTHYRSREDIPDIIYVGEKQNINLNLSLYIGNNLADLNGAEWSVKLLCRKNYLAAN